MDSIAPQLFQLCKSTDPTRKTKKNKTIQRREGVTDVLSEQGVEKAKGSHDKKTAVL
jgi:hypothetical protein